MASWQQLAQEIQGWAQEHPGLNHFDGVRQVKLAALKAITGRPIIVYAADWFNPKLPPHLSGLLGIDLTDIDFLRDVINSISGDEVDMLLYSPGGSAEAVESIVDQLRPRFRHIRVLIPGVAKSAATMLAMAADEILLDNTSELGPIDPQIVLNGRASPAGAILKQFELAQQQLKNDPSLMHAWLPVLQQCAPSLLVECQRHLNLSAQLVASWLAKFMFANQSDAQERARKVAQWLADDENFLSHARRVDIDDLRKRGLKVFDLSADQKLHEAVLQLHLALQHTFAGTGTFKLYESSEGVTIARSVQVQMLMPTVPPNMSAH